MKVKDKELVSVPPLVGAAEHRQKKEKLPVCVDFDGCVVAHHYPKIGQEAPHAVETLRKWCAGGVGIILDTMRCDNCLAEACEWMRAHGIELYGVGKDPGQAWWTKNNKAYVVFSVDDRNLGVPLVMPPGESRPVVDWNEIDRRFTAAILEEAKKYDGIALPQPGVGFEYNVPESDGKPV